MATARGRSLAHHAPKNDGGSTVPVVHRWNHGLRARIIMTTTNNRDDAIVVKWRRRHYVNDSPTSSALLESEITNDDKQHHHLIATMSSVGHLPTLSSMVDNDDN